MFGSLTQLGGTATIFLGRCRIFASPKQKGAYKVAETKGLNQTLLQFTMEIDEIFLLADKTDFISIYLMFK